MKTNIIPVEYKLRKANDPALHEECMNVDFSNLEIDPIQVAYNLVHTMYQNNGVGLSYNQCEIEGKPFSVFCMKACPQNLVLYNPILVDMSEEIVLLEEGCLTYPGLFIKIRRPKSIKIRFQTPNGDTRTEKYTGITSRIVQHELMHINGMVFWEGFSRYTFERGAKKSKVKVNFKG